MKLIFEINEQQFDEYKSFVKTNLPSDFYTVNSEKQIAYFYPFKNVKAFKRVESRLDHLNKHLTQDMKYRSLELIRGFIADDTAESYSYSTSGGNVWGVTRQDGKYILYFFGSRKLLVRLPFVTELAQEKATPLLIKTGGKSISNWYNCGLLPFFLDREKAVKHFAIRNLNKPLFAPMQTVWDKWIKDPAFLDDVMALKATKPNQS